MSFSVTGNHACVVLIYFVYPFAGVGARGWVVDIYTAGHGGWFHLLEVGLIAGPP